MQAGGKIEDGETPLDAVEGELAEELGLAIERSATIYLGRFVSEAAHERGHLVDAELFHVRTVKSLRPSAEIEEAIWCNVSEVHTLELAPLTEQHVLKLARSL